RRREKWTRRCSLCRQLGGIIVESPLELAESRRAVEDKGQQQQCFESEPERHRLQDASGQCAEEVRSDRLGGKACRGEATDEDDSGKEYGAAEDERRDDGP